MNKSIIIIICLIVAVPLAVTVIWPQYQDFQLKQFQIEEKNKGLQNRQEYYQELARISEELKGYPEELSKVDSALPPEASLPSLFNVLQKKASESGLILSKVDSVSEIPSKENQDIKEYNLDIFLIGSYPALKNFLLSLENSARLVEVKEASFSSSVDEKSPLVFKLTLKFHSY